MKTRKPFQRDTASSSMKMAQSLIKRLRRLMDFLVVIVNSRHPGFKRIRINLRIPCSFKMIARSMLLRIRYHFYVFGFIEGINITAFREDFRRIDECNEMRES